MTNYEEVDFSPIQALTDGEVITHSPVRDIRLASGKVLALITLDNGRDHTRPNTLGPATLTELGETLDGLKARAADDDEVDHGVEHASDEADADAPQEVEGAEAQAESSERARPPETDGREDDRRQQRHPDDEVRDDDRDERRHPGGAQEEVADDVRRDDDRCEGQGGVEDVPRGGPLADVLGGVEVATCHEVNLRCGERSVPCRARLMWHDCSDVTVSGVTS